tara:strand:+ start:30 stop:347 length:318 start_codon:yes stop_codon:yes gene_type:complete
MRIDEINAMAEEVYLKHENNDLLYGDSLELRLAYKAGVVDGYNKAKENYKVESSVRELHQYKLGLEDGYNKAEETLYTEEQVREAMEFARGYSKMTDTQFIQTLK